MEQSARKTGVLLGLLACVVALGFWYSSPRAAPPEDPRGSSVAAGGSPSDTADSAAAARREADEFANRALEAFRAAGLRELRYEPEQFRILIPELEGQRGHTIFLSNFLEEYRASPPEKRAEVLQRLVRFSTAPAEDGSTYAAVRSKLLPVIRPRFYFERSMLEGIGGPSDGGVDAGDLVAWEPLGGVLGLALVVDTPEAMRFVNPPDLKQWAVSFEQARAQAVENLRRQSREALATVSPGTCVTTWNDSYGSSRLVLDEVLRRCPVRGEPVVLVPNRDVMVVTGSHDEGGLLKVAELAWEAYQVPRPVDGRALRRTAKGWELFLPPKGSKPWLAFRKLWVESQRREYAAQTEQLNELHEQRGVDIFVAQFVPYEDEHGNAFSQAVWVRDIDTLLPRVDMVIFMDSKLGPDAPPVAVVRWDVVERDVGKLLAREEGLYPVRYRLKGFPSDAQLARWKKDPRVMDVP